MYSFFLIFFEFDISKLVFSNTHKNNNQRCLNDETNAVHQSEFWHLTSTQVLLKH